MSVTTFPETKLRTPRRTLNRLLLALTAFGLGGLAQSAFRRESLWDGLLLYLLAAFVFVRAVGLSQPLRPNWPPYRGLFVGLRLRAGLTRLSLGLWGVLGALFLSTLSVRFFGDSATFTQAWWVYGASLLVFVASLFIFTRGEPGQRRWNWPSLSPHTTVLLVILGLAIILRFWQFNSLPFGVWYDEAEAGLQARLWLEQASRRPAFYDPINVSGQFLLLYSLTLRFISNSIYGLRLVSILFGLAGILVAYLFGRAIHGPSFGLTMAFFMAVMRWDINFSRIAMTGIDAPFFILLTLLCLSRLLRHGRLRDAAFAGLTLGLGFSFYTAFRLFGLTLALFALIGVVVWRQWWLWRRDRRWWRDQLARGAILLIAFWLAAMPVLQYARRNPDSFSNRIEITSIFNRRDDPNLGRALMTSLGKHLAMFNISGDKNGRHNLPGEPMLDPVMGICFILGVALALFQAFRRQGHPASLFFLILLPVSLAGGIFSLDFEAPQSLRSIAAIPAVAYFCALTVMAVAAEAGRVTRPWPQKWLLWPAAVVGFYIIWLNGYTYFVRQASDFAVWNAYSTPETITGQRMAALGPDYTFILSPFFSNHPTIRFLSPATPDQITLPLPDAMPVRTDATRQVALFIHPDDVWAFEEAQRLYPAGQFETVSDKPSDPSAVHIAQLAPSDLASIQGLDLRYWSGTRKADDQAPVSAIRARTIDLAWPAAAPLPPPFVAEWQSILYVKQFGFYELRLETPAAAVLEIDGVEVLRGQGEQRIRWQLARGNHLLRLEAQSGDGPVQLSWQSPSGAADVIPAAVFYANPVRYNGLLGEYYSNSNWEGSPTIKQIDPFLNTYFHLTPLPRPYSIRWTGQLEVPRAGLYTMGLRSVGPSQLYIDDALVVDAQLPDQYEGRPLALQGGLHKIEVDFQDTLPRSRIHLWWIPDGETDRQPVPSRYLWPPLGSAWQPEVDTAAPTADFQPQPFQFEHLLTLKEGLVQPRDVAIGPQGNIYVVDSATRRVHVFSGDAPVTSWGETPDGPFEEPLALVVDETGTVWVLDSARQWVYGFDETGRPRGRLGGPEAHLYHPRGLALVSQRESRQALMIIDTGSGLLRLFSLDGAALGTVGLFGDAPGQFNEPVDALRDEFGTYYVTEGANINRWQRVDPFGQPLADWPLDAPVASDGSHLAWGPDGSIFMTNSAQSALRRYGPDGLLIDNWSAIDDVALTRPVGVFIDPTSSRLFVTDVAIAAVHVFRLAVGEPAN